MDWWMAFAAFMGLCAGSGLTLISIQYHYPDQWKSMIEIDKQRTAIRKESRRQRKAVR